MNIQSQIDCITTKLIDGKYNHSKCKKVNGDAYVLAIIDYDKSSVNQIFTGFELSKIKQKDMPSFIEIKIKQALQVLEMT